MVMSDADWTTMRAAPPLGAIEPGRWDHQQAVLLSSDDGAWRPSTDAGIQAAQTWLPHVQFLTAGYSPAGAGRTRVYLLWGQS